jgi:ELWxxDGT repeat protein
VDDPLEDISGKNPGQTVPQIVDIATPMDGSYKLEVSGAGFYTVNVFSYSPTGVPQRPVTWRGSCNASAPSDMMLSLAGGAVTSPILDPLRASWVADTGDPLTFGATGTDAAGDPLVFSLAPGAPAGAMIDPTSGTFSWTPGLTQAPGAYTVGIRATDANNPNLSDQEDVKISVIKRTATLVTDINTFGQGSSPTSLVNVNGTVFFVATVAGLGMGLYKSDGTAAGTKLVKNFSGTIGPGTFSELTGSGNLLFFTYDFTDTSGIHERQLWRSDGTAIGTFWLMDLHPIVNFNDPMFPYYPSHLTDVNGTLFFLDYDIFTWSNPSGL